MDGIEFTLGSTQSASDALVFVHFCGATAEAARRLPFYLFLGKGQAIVAEALRLGGIMEHRLTLRVVIIHGDHSAALVKLLKLP